MARIHGNFYQNDVKAALRYFGPLTMQQIKGKLELRNVKLDETQILDALDTLIKGKYVRKGTEGLYVLWGGI